jgi:2-polyprenyl-6-methoxyphenol hydroxylase-like FAD-dependent oxidoreductase
LGYVQELGIKVEFSTTVEDYFETDGEGVVILADGQKLAADLVVAADGVDSKSWALVLGEKDTPITLALPATGQHFQLVQPPRTPSLQRS